MKTKGLFLLLLLIPFLFSCEEKSEEFKVAEPVTYYLSDAGLLKKTPGPHGDWQIIIHYIYPTGPNNSVSWSTYLDRNIVRGQFGCDLVFWAQTECQIRIDIILKEGTQETVLATYDLTVRYIDDETAIGFKNDAEANPWVGINPKGGKNDYLVLRFTHISGTDPVEIYCEGAVGYFGCTHLTVFHDK
jgi:hypothetical protein